MKWNDYLNSILSQETNIDDIVIGKDGNKRLLTPILKASILLLMKMSSENDKNHIFVFPNTNSIKIKFLISKTIFDILSGRITSEYDPYSFVNGQKLRYEDCIVVFEKCETEKDGREFITISFSEKGTTFKIPMELAPYFQKVDSKKTSKFSSFHVVYKQNQKKQIDVVRSTNKRIVEYLKNNKTHLNSSIVYVSEIKETKEKLLNLILNGNNLSDLLYLAQINSDGIVNNMASGQMSGNPAIVVASDLYSVQNAISNGLNVHRIIVDITKPNSIDGQLDAFDNLSESGIPITCLTDTAHSFELQALKDRGFLEWRWDEKSITGTLYSGISNKTEKRRLSNCREQKTEYIIVQEHHVSDSIKLLYKYKDSIEERSSQLITVYKKIFSIAYLALRNFSPLTEIELSRYCTILDECETKINSEKRFLPEAIFNDLLNITISLKQSFIEDKLLLKIEKTKEYLLTTDYKSVCIVITENQDKERIHKYWNEWRGLNRPEMNITVMYQKEYQNAEHSFSDLTIVPCWMKMKLMKDVIYRFSSPNYLILLFDCETRWKNAHTRFWKQKLANNDNLDIIKRKLENDTSIYYESVVRDVTVPEYSEPQINENTDELEDIEQILLQSKYGQYNASGRPGDTVVDAIPVSFVGGLLSFYRTGHEVITVTDIIQQSGSAMKLKNAENIEIGDFIVVRDAQKDLIREIADSVLKEEGMESVRNISQLWKESLKIEQLFSSDEEIYEKLQKIGCQRGKQTVMNWLSDEDYISPQSKEDLISIAKATNDGVLLKKVDIVFNAGKEVKSAHIKAGKILSDRLKQLINIRIQNMESLDPYNIWDPIQIDMEGIGMIRILKVIDKGSSVPVELINTNRLLSE